VGEDGSSGRARESRQRTTTSVTDYFFLTTATQVRTRGSRTKWGAIGYQGLLPFPFRG
jgi:hypothetical protein